MPGAAAGAPRVLVTRPAHDAQHWVRQLQQGGFDAQALPLIEIAPVTLAADLARLAQVRQSLADYAALMFVSANAVAHFFESNKAAAQVICGKSAINKIALPAALRFLAPGPGTRAALLAAGVDAGQIDAPPADAPQFDSESLWQVVGQKSWSGSRVLVVRGQSQAAAGHGEASPGRDWLTRQWQSAGAVVEMLSSYERRAPLLSADQLGVVRSAATDRSVWLFSSSEALANLLALPGCNGIDWRLARAVATHPRIAVSVRSAGWGVVKQARPALNEIVSTLRSIESAYP